MVSALQNTEEVSAVLFQNGKDLPVSPGLTVGYGIMVSLKSK
jgi:hypothetical protein